MNLHEFRRLYPSARYLRVGMSPVTKGLLYVNINYKIKTNPVAFEVVDFLSTVRVDPLNYQTTFHCLHPNPSFFYSFNDCKHKKQFIRMRL